MVPNFGIYSVFGYFRNLLIFHNFFYLDFKNQAYYLFYIFISVLIYCRISKNSRNDLLRDCLELCQKLKHADGLVNSINLGQTAPYGGV